MNAKALIATAVLVALTLTLCGTASADPYCGGVPLTTEREGVVSGDLWFDHCGPMVSGEWTKDYTLPAYTDVDWAHLYVAVYCGHMQSNRQGRANITFNEVQLGGAPDGLSSEVFNVSYSYPGTGGTGPAWVNDHCVRVTSDYTMWYNVTGLVEVDSDVCVKTWKKEDYIGVFDGRIKAVTLVVAYNDGDSDTVYYWFNQGHDTDNYYWDDLGNPNYIGETNFTASLPPGATIQNANLTAVHMASQDGAYTFNGVSIPTDPNSGTTPPGENGQFPYTGYNTWYAPDLFNSNSNNILTYDRNGPYYKITQAFLSAEYTEGNWYWKDYNGEEEGGYMPDFDQNQNGWQNYCAPTAEANSLWWFAQKYPDREVVPPGATPQDLIQELAWLMDTNGQRTGNLHAGTYVEDEQAGVEEYLIQHGLTDLLYEHTELKPEFGWIEAEIERCQDVKLDLGFYEVIDVVEIEPGHWQIQWQRIGGHAVTAAGVDSENFMIAISDPDADNAEFGLPGVIRGPNHNHGGVPFHDPAYDHTQHNDGVSASHDIYNVAPSISPGGTWALTDLYWRQPETAYQYYENNGGTWINFTETYIEIPPEIGEIFTEIEAAVVVSPVPCTPGIEVNKTVWDPDAQAWVKEIDASVNDVVRFRLWVHNNGTCCDLTNITVTDMLSDSLNYSDNATVNGVPQEPVQIGPNEYVWNFTGPLAPCQNITIEFDAQVVECGNDTNVVNVTAWCNETMVSDGDSASVHAPCGICGDVDGLPGVTTNDGRQIFMYLLYGPGQYPIHDLWAADCDGLCDGITTNDGRQIFMNLLYGPGQYPLVCC